MLRCVATTSNDGSTEYKTGWAGSAVMATITAPKHTAFAYMCGVLVKCARNQVRPTTNQGSLGAELSKQYFAELREEKRRVHQNRATLAPRASRRSYRGRLVRHIAWRRETLLKGRRPLAGMLSRRGIPTKSRRVVPGSQ